MSTSSPTWPLSLTTAGEPVPLPATDAHGALLSRTDADVLVTLYGEVDCADGPALASVRALLAAWQARPVVEASGVTFIDPAGLRAVLSLVSDGSALLVLAPSPAFQHLLHLLAMVNSSVQVVPAVTGARSRRLPSQDLPAGSILIWNSSTSAREAAGSVAARVPSTAHA